MFLTFKKIDSGEPVVAHQRC